MKASVFSLLHWIAISLAYFQSTEAFCITNSKTFVLSHERSLSSRVRSICKSSSDDENVATENKSDEVKLTLEEKMKKWEATEEEAKAATLGGIGMGRPAGQKQDGFDIGLLIAFPIMVGSSLLFILFPFIKDTIDVTSVGPPPTV